MRLLKRKVTAVLLSAALVTGLAGCGPSADQGDSSVVQLTLQTHYSLQQEQELKKYIDKWNKNHPNIQVKHKFVDFAQLLPTIMAKQTTGQQADILHVYSLWGGQLAKGNVLAEPTAEVKKDIEASYPAAAVNGATVNGKLLGYPTEVQTYGLYYNKKLLQEEGYSAPPKTWDELYQMAKKITKRDTSGKVLVEGYGPPMGESFQETAVVHPYLSLLYAAGGQFISKDGKKAELNSPIALKTLQFQEKLIKEEVTDTSFNVLKGFPSEKVAMTINAGWWNGSLKATMKDKYKNIGVAPIPSPDGKGQGSISYSFFYGVSKKSRHQKEAWEFLKWLNSEAQENGATAEGNFLVSQGIIPARNSDIKAMDKELSNPNNQPFIDALKYAVPEPNIEQGQKVKTILMKNIESVWSGQITPEQALQSSTEEITQTLNQ